MSTETKTTTVGQAPPAGKREQWWSPRIWVGSDFFGLWRLLVRNRFRVSPTHIHIALLDLCFSVGHTTLRGLQSLIYGRAIERTEVQPPIFILGHWRSGTTLLHELLILDSRHTFATTYQCLEPNHFLLTERIVSRWMRFLLPDKRPMDNMAFGWDRPQEDEFALCNLGVPSPYCTIAFPNHPPQYQEFLELEEVEPSQLAHWKHGLMHFLKHITYLNPKRIVLKSPPHTARIKVLLEMFPDARFIHIVRNPYVVFPSTVHLWKRLYGTHALQNPTFEGLEEHVLETFVRMQSRLEATRHLVDPARFCELKYEDLVADPMAQMRRIYEHLNLGEFENVEPAFERYFEDAKDYQTNRYEIKPEMRERIRQHWGEFIEKYGYDDSL